MTKCSKKHGRPWKFMDTWSRGLAEGTLHESERTDSVCCWSSGSVYPPSAYKAVHPVAHLTQYRLKALLPSRGIYVVSQHEASRWAKSITRRSHGGEIWQDIDEAGASMQVRLAGGYDGGKFEKGRWLKGSCARRRTEQSSGPLAAPLWGRRPRDQRGQCVSLMYRQIWSAPENSTAAALVTEEEDTKSKWFQWNHWAPQRVNYGLIESFLPDNCCRVDS